MALEHFHTKQCMLTASGAQRCLTDINYADRTRVIQLIKKKKTTPQHGNKGTNKVIA